MPCVAAAVAAAAAAAAAPDGTWPEMLECGAAAQLPTCHSGGAYNKTAAASATECCGVCTADAPRCQSWTYNSHNKNPPCHLHSDPLTSSDNDTKCISGPPPRVPVPTPAPAPPAPLPQTARNILYVVVDDLRNELHFTDARKGLVTPVADALAKKGMVFSRAYVQQGVCSPSRNSFLSGRRPDTTKIWNFQKSFRDNLGDAVSSWPGAFKNAGYVTAGLGKVYHPGHPKNDDGELSWSLDAFPYFHPKGFEGKISDASDSKFQDGMSTDTAIQYLQTMAANSTRPFFLAVGLHKPHIPWVMPQRFLDMQVAEADIDTATHDTPPTGYCNVSLYRCPGAGVGGAPLPWEPAEPAKQRTARRLYRAAVSWTDHNLGRLLDELDTLSLTENTAVVFHGDHGWHLGEHGLWCKQSNFELVARIPLVIYVPWLPQSHGQQSAALVEVVDLMPTTIDLMGIASRVHDFADLEGTSFVPLLEQPGTPEAQWKNASFTQYPRCNGTSSTSGKSGKGDLLPWDFPSNNPCTGVNPTDFQAMGYSIRSAAWRYTLWLKWDGAAAAADWGSVVGEELYDHSGDDGTDTDAFENENLAADPGHAAVREQLAAALRLGWRHALPPAP